VTFLGVQAHDRLKTFSSGVALWEDAVSKLPAGQIPGGWRTLYQAGRQYLYAGAPEKATAVIDRCLVQYPRESHCLLARASISMHLERYDDAIPYLTSLLADQPRNPDARHHLGLVLEELGCRERAREQYQLAAKLGSSVAHWRLENLNHPGKGFISKSQEARRAGPCRVASMRIEAPQSD
jgi:tetratricopeptide (TPR) repeat protein